MNEPPTRIPDFEWLRQQEFHLRDTIRTNRMLLDGSPDTPSAYRLRSEMDEARMALREITYILDHFRDLEEAESAVWTRTDKWLFVALTVLVLVSTGAAVLWLI